jgi:hypothetical protein
MLFILGAKALSDYLVSRRVSKGGNPRAKAPSSRESRKIVKLGGDAKSGNS